MGQFLKPKQDAVHVENPGVYTENKRPRNAGPTTVTIAYAEWIDHIGS